MLAGLCSFLELITLYQGHGAISRIQFLVVGWRCPLSFWPSALEVTGSSCHKACSINIRVVFFQVSRSTFLWLPSFPHPRVPRQNLIYNITKSQEWLVIILRFLSHSRIEDYTSYAHLLTGSENLGGHLEFCLLYFPPKVAISSECKLHCAILWLLIHSWVPINYKINIFFDTLDLSLESLS